MIQARLPHGVPLGLLLRLLTRHVPVPGAYLEHTRTKTVKSPL